jgi:cation:H+ antiporter
VSMPLAAVLFAVGLVLLVGGAEGFIRGAVRIARRFGVSPFVIGLTLVGIGTSAPELAVNLSAVANESPGLAVGNVVGSNVANVGLILGVAALIRPLVVQMRMLKVELPVMIAVAFVLLAMAWDGHIGRAEGGLMLFGFAAMMVFLLRSGRDEPPEVKAEIGGQAAEKAAPAWAAGLLILVGLAAMVGGANLMVEAATAVARQAGVSDIVIGLTVVAVGTSLPELASTVAAARKGEADIAVGNVIGSNIFNVLLVLGTTACVSPLPIDDPTRTADIPVMIGFSVLLLPVMARGRRVSRREGGLLLAAYAGYLVWQVVRANG